MLIPCSIGVQFTLDPQGRAAAIITWIDHAGRLIARSGYVHPDSNGTIVIEEAGIKVEDTRLIAVHTPPAF